ncbi:MAG: hypothetical protein KDA80_24460, partial [Planctomycetaceae bacterium]|nr:hypothetical protein [Planctomycetaceae bacterium]
GLVDRELDLDKQLKAGEPRVLAHERLAEWNESRADTVELWTRIQQHLPTTDRIYFTDFRVTPQSGEVVAKITGTGQAKQRADVDDMYQRLAENGFRVTPTATRTARKDPDFPVQFDLNVDLLRDAGPNEKPPAIASSEVRS